LVGKVRVGLAFARGGLLANLSLHDNAALPLRFLGLPLAVVEGRVAVALERLGLSRVAGLRPHAVSDTARKHANLARVLALEPTLILLDDPLGGLESTDRGIALDLIRDWAANAECTLVIAAEDAQPFALLGADHHPLTQTALTLEPT
jgi:ABC-type transporter Mla maintaining outer membrane lipid asymmetry ATPase subunit MlaF